MRRMKGGKSSMKVIKRGNRGKVIESERCRPGKGGKKTDAEEQIIKEEGREKGARN